MNQKKLIDPFTSPVSRKRILNYLMQGSRSTSEIALHFTGDKLRHGNIVRYLDQLKEEGLIDFEKVETKRRGPKPKRWYICSGPETFLRIFKEFEAAHSIRYTEYYHQEVNLQLVDYIALQWAGTWGGDDLYDRLGLGKDDLLEIFKASPKALNTVVERLPLPPDYEEVVIAPEFSVKRLLLAFALDTVYFPPEGRGVKFKFEVELKDMAETRNWQDAETIFKAKKIYVSVPSKAPYQ